MGGSGGAIGTAPNTAATAGASPSAGVAASAIAGQPATTVGAAETAGASGAAATSGADADITTVCKGGKVGMDSMSATFEDLNVAREYGAVKYLAASGIEIVNMKTTLKVPKTPTQKQTLFIWPALQCRGAADPARVQNGILQPVLTWGPSCNPKLPSAEQYNEKWWIAGMYVNVSSRVAGPSGCTGGDFMLPEVSDLLDIEITLKGMTWTQTVVNQRNNEKVDFSIDLMGQVQNWATWAVEVPSGSSVAPAEDTVYLKSVLTFNKPVTSCQPDQAGKNDYFSAPILSPDGLHCCYDEIVMRKH
jgi:hypothetical protein